MQSREGKPLEGLLVLLEGKVLKVILAQRCLEHTGLHWLWHYHPGKVSQVVAHLLDHLHPLIQEVTEVRVCVSRTEGMEIQEDLVQVLLWGQGGFHDLLGLSSFTLRWLLHILEE